LFGVFAFDGGVIELGGRSVSVPFAFEPVAGVLDFVAGALAESDVAALCTALRHSLAPGASFALESFSREP